MGLIDVPKTKEEIAAYLADGNTRSVPFVTSSDVNDGEILGQTSTVDLGGGSYKFVTTLPSGRPLESAPIGPDYSKRDATYQWVEAVRANIVGDFEQAADAAARAQREAEPLTIAPVAPEQYGQLSSPGIGVINATPAVNQQPASSDPVEYAREQLHAALQRMASLADAEQQVERWQRVVNSLTGEVVAHKKRRKKRRKKVSA